MNDGTINAKRIKGLIEDGFRRLRILDDIKMTAYREKLFRDCLADEKGHRRHKPESLHRPAKAPASLAAKYFAVKWMLDALDSRKRAIGAGCILDSRAAWVLARALGIRYRKEVRRALRGFPVDEFRTIDYCESLCG